MFVCCCSGVREDLTTYCLVSLSLSLPSGECVRSAPDHLCIKNGIINTLINHAYIIVKSSMKRRCNNILLILKITPPNCFIYFIQCYSDESICRTYYLSINSTLFFLSDFSYIKCFGTTGRTLQNTFKVFYHSLHGSHGDTRHVCFALATCLCSPSCYSELLRGVYFLNCSTHSLSLT